MLIVSQSNHNKTLNIKWDFSADVEGPIVGSEIKIKRYENSKSTIINSSYTFDETDTKSLDIDLTDNTMLYGSDILVELYLFANEGAETVLVESKKYKVETEQGLDLFHFLLQNRQLKIWYDGYDGTIEDYLNLGKNPTFNFTITVNGKQFTVYSKHAPCVIDIDKSYGVIKSLYVSVDWQDNRGYEALDYTPIEVVMHVIGGTLIGYINQNGEKKEIKKIKYLHEGGDKELESLYMNNNGVQRKIGFKYESYGYTAVTIDFVPLP